jgi:hypothetical protein
MHAVSWKAQNATVQSGAFQRGGILRLSGHIRLISGGMHYTLYKHMKKNLLPAYFHKEVMQHWINPKGEVRTMSLSTNAFSQAYDQWKFFSPLEIRPKGFEHNAKYRINPYRVYPQIKVIMSWVVSFKMKSWSCFIRLQCYKTKKPLN